ncbi:MAG: GEVED domain-containing protein [Bacteroidia bacterium]
MKKVLLLLFSLLFIRTVAFATYSIDWMSTPDLLANTGSSIATDADNNVYTTTNYEASIYVEKRDRFGVFQWQRISSTTLQFNYETAVKVHIDPQGNPVVVGYRHTVSSDGHNANALIVLKYDPAGTLQYKQVIQGTFSYFNNSQYWTRVTSQMDATGNVYIGTAGAVSGYPGSGYNVVKVSPSGNVVRVSSKLFPSATNFHYVSQIRLYGDKLGLAGVTDYAYANATTWVVDTAGNDLWNNISTGVQGRDIAFDQSGNAYMCTWISIAQMGDIAIYKFDVNGNSLWNQTYDFGGSDAGGTILPSADGNFVIMASGNQAPSTSFYIDWITFKVDTAGTLLWSDRYDETTHNDEYPGAMAVDAMGNTYVTGIGGPFPGGTSTISTRQMITVKYTPNGTREWYSPVDTLNLDNKGAAICIGADSSVFVIGYINSLIIHYLDHTGSAPCTVPTNAGAAVISNDSTRISWNPVTNAYLYHVRYKTATSLVWETLSTNSTSAILYPLYPGTVYDFAVEAICNSGPTGYSATQQFTTTGVGYCQSMGVDGNHDWIDLVFIENLLNSTPDPASGYSDFTHLSTTLIPGSTYNITLSAGIDPGGANESWKIWIDFNGNNDFSDPGEEVVSYVSNQIGWETSTFTVPATATAGTTRMRVSLKNGSPAQTPCETFALGEVEDYTVILSGTTSVQQQNSISEKILVYPNPAQHVLTIESSNNQNIQSVELCDLSGRVLLSDLYPATGRISVDVHAFSKGIYLLRVTCADQSVQTSRWIKE